MESGSDAPVELGRLNGPWGVAGWVKVLSWTDPPENIFEYQPWRIADPPGLLRVLEWRRQGPRLVARLEGVDDRTAAERLGRHVLTVPRDDLPPAGEDSWYWHDLVGLEVRNGDDRVLGEVTGLIDTGAHDVLEVRAPSGAPMLVPFVVGETVRDVDLGAGRIVVEWEPDW
ncbi:MAG: ribosome maturation factor RimM [Wenzhouxiangellaceae bacterium]|nr:ribosome maturation factor RimM [Wenzhouxiangellaceae bacterium]